MLAKGGRSLWEEPGTAVQVCIRVWAGSGGGGGRKNKGCTCDDLGSCMKWMLAHMPGPPCMFTPVHTALQADPQHQLPHCRAPGPSCSHLFILSCRQIPSIGYHMAGRLAQQGLGELRALAEVG